MKEIKQIGENIRKYRLKKNLTQLDLAAACGFEESSIGRLENGNTNPTIKTLLKIAKALDVKLSDLVKIK
ncbi:MAG TPA: helix-turn-helix transcriptional regulator [Bacteroidia bacterium]|nr:helix-turn-helix transcriptional regulator [Bacteroidia bacterium]